MALAFMNAERLPTGEELLREAQRPTVPIKAILYTGELPYLTWTRDYGAKRFKRVLEIEALVEKVRINHVSLNEDRCAILPILPSYTLMLHEKMRYEVFCDEALRVEIKSDFGVQILHPQEKRLP
ncbi:hypothetical protein ACFOPX_08105 [Helicobacter baculiformis]|uniref:Uncharacterized protein n=1 Tax=Helicobacter baculiformis TaxID=427351 RepID=A0ABV7ZIS9_9HELI|nr:hypothetical protein [Helicobacter baculiformis]